MQGFSESDNATIKYSVQGGQLAFSYVRTIVTFNSRESYVANGLVPQESIEKGTEAINAYVNEYGQTEVTKKKAEADKRKNFLGNLNIPIKTNHPGGEVLRGVIFKALNNRLQVRLTEPEIYKGEHFVDFGFGSAMAGRSITDQDGNISEAAILAAKRLLIQIYEKVKDLKENKHLYDLAKQLNG